MEKEIIWTQTTLNQLENIYFYLLKETKSFEIANKVVDKSSNFLDATKKLSKGDWLISNN